MPTANEIIPRLWEILNSFSDDARKAARKKAKELELDPNKGDVPLNESLVNLDTAATTLRDAVEKQKLIQLPLTIQKEILTRAESVSGFLAGLNSGSDEIINLVNSIEQLNTAIWQYGLHNLSGEVLGYQTKMNQLKNEEDQLRKLRDEIEEGLKRKEQLFALLEETKSAVTAISSAKSASDEYATKIHEKLEEASTKAQNASALVSTIEQNETSSTKQAASAKTSAAEAQAMEAKVKEFFAEIDEYRKKIDSVSSDARTNVDANRAETKDLVVKLIELEGQIKKQIERATGFSLFHSFQARQEKVTSAKNFWGGVLGVVILISLGITIYIAHSTENFDIAFYLKLSMSIPLIYGISFCTIQYSRERRLEEEYAFKSAISISLDPYQQLVSRLIDNTQTEERQKFTVFILDSIQKVFTSPTERIFEPKENNKLINEKTLKRLAEIVGHLSKAAKP